MAADSVAPAAELREVSLSWPGASGPTVVLDQFYLSVEEGSFTAIVGPSGCGKSTVLRILAGLQEVDSGEALIDGADVVGLPGSCAWLPQKDNLLPWRTVLANATLGAELGGVDVAEADRQALELLGRFGLGGYEKAWPSELSGGMRQRLALLRTFLTPLPMLLLDEPFGALDALTRRQMQEWLAEVWLDDSAHSARDGRTVVLVTHDVEEALLLADRVVVLSQRPARIVADVEVSFERPRSGGLVTDPLFVAQRGELLASLGL